MYKLKYTAIEHFYFPSANTFKTAVKMYLCIKFQFFFHSDQMTPGGSQKHHVDAIYSNQSN